MSTPTKTGQIRPDNTHQPAQKQLFYYPEDIPMPENGFSYGQILHCLFERADTVLEIMNPDSTVSDKYTVNAFWTIRGFLEQGMKIADRLNEEEEQAQEIN